MNSILTDLPESKLENRAESSIGGKAAFLSTSRLAMESREARQIGWLTRSTVRSLRPGTHFDLIGLPHDRANPKAEHKYLTADITHVGINNLSGEAIAAIAQRLGQGHLNTDGEGLSTGDNFTPASAPDELWCDALALGRYACVAGIDRFLESS